MLWRPWPGKHTLDADGLRLLGIALWMNKRRQQKVAQRHARGLSTWMDELTVDSRYLQRIRDEIFDLETALHDLGLTSLSLKHFLSARRLTIASFHYGWRRLFENPWVAAYLKPKKTELCPLRDDVPICRMPSERNLVGLEAIFRDEFLHQMEGEFKEFIKPTTPQTDSEWLFCWLNADVCEPPMPKGAPAGRRYQDGLRSAASCAWSIRHRTRCSARKAASEALSYFKVIPPHYKGKITADQIIANSEETALKRIVELLAEIERAEPAISDDLRN